MLSYMVPSPIDDKPPVAPPPTKNGLQLALDSNHLTSNGVVSNSTTTTIIHLNGGAVSDRLSTTSSCQKKIIKNNVAGSTNSSNSSLNSNNNDLPSVHGATNTSSFADRTRTRIANGNTKQTALKR